MTPSAHRSSRSARMIARLSRLLDGCPPPEHCGCELPSPCWILVWIDDVSQCVCPGDTVTGPLLIANQRARSRTFTIVASDPSTRIAPAKLTLGPLEDGAAVLPLEVPAQTSPGYRAQIIVSIEGCRTYLFRSTVSAVATGFTAVGAGAMWWSRTAPTMCITGTTTSTASDHARMATLESSTSLNRQIASAAMPTLDRGNPARGRGRPRSRHPRRRKRHARPDRGAAHRVASADGEGNGGEPNMTLSPAEIRLKPGEKLLIHLPLCSMRLRTDVRYQAEVATRGPADSTVPIAVRRRGSSAAAGGVRTAQTLGFLKILKGEGQ
jgi:hypothetical protein